MFKELVKLNEHIWELKERISKLENEIEVQGCIVEDRLDHIIELLYNLMGES